MKKLFVILSAALMLGINANAQETFYPGWNFGFQAGATYHATTWGAISRWNCVSYPTIGLNLGYEFAPWVGLRADLSGFTGKGKDVNVPEVFNFNYVQLGLDAMFDICNMFKFRSERTVNPYIFVGPGVNVRFNNQASAAVKGNQGDYYWGNTTVGFAVRGGAGINFRLSDAVKLSLEVVDNALGNKYNSVKDDSFDDLKKGAWFNGLDHNFSALLGLKFTFGQANAKAAAIAAAAAAAAEAAAAKAAAEKAAAEAAEAARLAAEKAAAEKAAAERAAAEKAAAEAAAAKAAAHKQAVDAVNAALNDKLAYPRFIIGKYNLTKDAKKKVAAAAEILKVNPDVKLNLTGYADKETGTAAGNWTLSQKRAEAIADALVEKGIEASQLVPAWKGDTEVPFEGAKPAQKRTVTFFAE